MSYIPAEVFKDPGRGMQILEVLDAVQHIVPRQSPSSLIPVSDRARLSTYNRRSIDKEITDANLQEELERFTKSKELFSEIPKAKTEYIKYESGFNAMNNRFTNTKRKSIQGVGVDGSYFHPKNYTQDKMALANIQEGAEKFDKWTGYSGDEEEMVRESIGNTIFWQNASFGQLSVGTPTQVASFVIGMASLVKDERSGFDFLEEISGADFLKKRVECAGLKYLLEGNKLDLADDNFNGIDLFLNTKFKRLFYDKNDNIRILVKNDYSVEKKICSNANGTTGHMFDKEIVDCLKATLSGGGTDEDKAAVIIFMYSIFWMYIAYINSFYELLLKTITDKTIYGEYEKAKNEMVTNFLNLINYAIKKKFKLDDSIDVKDMIVAVQSKTSGTPTKLDLNTTKVALNGVTFNDKKSNVFFGFSEPGTYDKIKSTGGVDNEVFKSANFPIVFSPPVITGTSEIKLIDYRLTIERLTKFLLFDDDVDIPKLSDGTLIAVGAPFQNDEILQATAEALGGYYNEVSESKSLYLNYMDTQINIFRAGVPAREVLKYRDYLLNNFGLIGTTMTTQVQKDAECLKLAGLVLDQYKKLRKEELMMTDDKTIFIEGRRRKLGEELVDYPRQLFRAMKRVKAGTEAVLRIEVAKLTFGLYMKRNPGVPMCGNFLSTLIDKAANIDKSMNDELMKIMERKSVELERKYGKNALKNIIKSATLITLNSIPKPPDSYMQTIASMYGLVGAKISIQAGVPGGPAAAPGGPIAKTQVTLEQRLRIESPKFWIDLKTAFTGKLLFFPIARLDNAVFDDNEFYIMDVINSMIREQLLVYKLKPLTPKTLYTRLQQFGYLMVTANNVDLGSPAKWRALNYIGVRRLLKAEDRFRDIRFTRNIFFNLLANTSFLTDSMNVSIPEASKTSLAIVKYCTNILEKSVDKCNIIISRQLFGQTVQGKMSQSSGTTGIDIAGGSSYASFSPTAGISENNVVKR